MGGFGSNPDAPMTERSLSRIANSLAQISVSLSALANKHVEAAKFRAPRMSTSELQEVQQVLNSELAARARKGEDD